MKVFLFFDIETTGLDERIDQIHQIGVFGNYDFEFSGYVKFDGPIRHNLVVPNDVERKSLDTVLYELYQKLDKFKKDNPECTMYIGGQNVNAFDLRFLKKSNFFVHMILPFFNHKIIDILLINSFLRYVGFYGVDSDMSLSLENVTRYYRVINDKPHDALGDAKASYLVYVEMCKRARQLISL